MEIVLAEQFVANLEVLSYRLKALIFGFTCTVSCDAKHPCGSDLSALAMIKNWYSKWVHPSDHCRHLHKSQLERLGPCF